MKIVSLSGGADSTAAAILLKERGEEFVCLFADTGAELPETYWIIPRIARELDVKLVIVNGPTFYNKLVTRNFLLPGFKVRWCTRELKGNPLDKWIRAQEEPEVHIGIRADEEHRARRPIGAPTKAVYTWPLVDAGMGKKDVLRLCESRGLLNPCYKWRTNCSCFCCPFQRKRDWKNLLETHPDLFALAEDWEQQSALSSENTRFAWSDGYTLTELRLADEQQMSMFAECAHEPCTICAI